MIKRVFMKLTREARIAYNRFYKILFSDAVFVYQMGKVGSSSLAFSLRKSGIDVEQIHCYRKFNMHHLTSKKLYSNITSGINTFFYRIAFKLRKKPMKIITLMRDPVARNISAGFHFLAPLLDRYFNDEKNRKENHINQCISESIKLYLNNEMPFTWFKDELEHFTKTDILNYDFDKEKGYLIIKNGKFEILVLICEKLNDNVEAVREFVEIDTFKFINNNMGKNKWYSSIYKDFKVQYKIDNDEIDKFYHNNIVEYFYSDEMINSFINKWTDKPK